MKIGVGVANSGPGARGLISRAIVAEEAGYDTLWITDHIVNPLRVDSAYPYQRDGHVPWSPDNSWFDAIVSMTSCATATRRIEIASGVMVIALREPLSLASQLASLDVLSAGRITLGVGAGWLAEEFEAVGVDFATRGPRTDEYIDVIRSLWAGPLGPYQGEFVHLPQTVLCEPRPTHRIEVIIGGSSSAALRRAGWIGDGWYGLFPEPIPPEELEKHLAVLRAAAKEKNRDHTKMRIIVSAGHASPERAELLLAYRELGVNEIVIRTELSDVEIARDSLDRVRDELGEDDR